MGGANTWKTTIATVPDRRPFRSYGFPLLQELRPLVRPFPLTARRNTVKYTEVYTMENRKMTYEEIKAKQEADRLMHQWWTLLSERERQKVVNGIRGCLEYGCTVMVQRMPDAGKQAIKDAYGRHLKHAAELEAKYPSE